MPKFKSSLISNNPSHNVLIIRSAGREEVVFCDCLNTFDYMSVYIAFIQMKWSKVEKVKIFMTLFTSRDPEYCLEASFVR